ncbi:gliding motility-associated-like protein [Chitinophaga skermanii]|uniref:Gliding motility-associated-like protein n=1 Tax=Chitinophaga skermanii TaxID=331697 RepID=A0A327Q7B2_9BACT|nr:gliding motility-associated C-terminal domain-containing protein [Chitinophaga skermanii]RAJ00260.1 gliding motility-associated-like protein [Chitinophaga skermanii]
MPRKLFLLFLLVVASLFQVKAQTCSPGQSPASALPLCATKPFQQGSVPQCAGQAISLGGAANGNNCQASSFTPANAFWYKIICYQTGPLGFTITPNQLSEDYDWLLFEVKDPNDLNKLYTDPSWIVAHNLSTVSGATGAAANTNPLKICGIGDPRLFTQKPVLTQGKTYLLVVVNFRATQNGYSVTFNNAPGDANITDPVALNYTKATYNCTAPTKIILKLSKSIQCNSINANGDQFELKNSTVQIVAASSVNCNSKLETDEIELTLNQVPTSGDYNVGGKPGATLPKDFCDNAIPLTDVVPVRIDAPSPLVAPTISNTACNPTSLTLTFASNIQANSISADGSNFTITGGPAPITVTAAVPNTGVTNAVVLTLSAPLGTGTYTLSAVKPIVGANCTGQFSGTIGNVVISPGVPATITAENPLNCGPTNIKINFNKAVNCNSIASDGSDFTIVNSSNVVIPIASIIKSNCTGTNGNTGTTSTITLVTSTPLPGGSYTVRIKQGTDGGTITEPCGGTTNTGVQATFTAPTSTAAIIQSVTNTGCAPNELTVTFDKGVLCNTITGTDGNFVLTSTGTQATITSFAPLTCDANGLTTSVTLRFNTRLAANGDYTISTKTNTIRDGCGNFVNANGTIRLTNGPGAGFAGSSPVGCAPTFFQTTFDKGVQASTVTQNDFTITGPTSAPVPFSSITTTIDPVTGLVTGVRFNFAAPLSLSGDYTIAIKPASQLLDECYQPQNSAKSEIVVDVPLATAPVISVVAPTTCAASSLVVNFSKPVLANTIQKEDFNVVTGSVVPVSNIVLGTQTGNEVSQVTLQFASALTGANVDVNVKANSINDACLQYVTTIVRTVPLITSAPATIDNHTLNDCAPNSIRITLSKAIQCNSVRTNGADFTIIGPQTVVITAATPVCNGSNEATAIDLTLQSRITLDGNYNLALTPSANIIDACLTKMDVNAAPHVITLSQGTAAALSGTNVFACAPVEIIVYFDKAVQTSTINANGSDFTFAGRTGITITSVVKPTTTTTNSVTLLFSGPIIGTAPVSVAVKPNTILDACFKQVNPAPLNINMPVTADPTFTVDPAATCAPNQIVLQFPQFIRGTSITANGADFTITGPQAVTINNATYTVDNQGFVSTITLTLAEHLAAPGNYTVGLKTSANILDQCYKPIATNFTQTLNIAPVIAAAINRFDPFACAPTRITIYFSDDVQTNSISLNGSDFDVNLPPGVSITNVEVPNTATTRTATLVFNQPIKLVASITIAVKPNTILDKCYQQVNPNPFIIPFPITPDPTFNVNTVVGCAPNSITLSFPLPVRQSTIRANGVDFSITGPSTVNVTGIQYTPDANGFVPQITLSISPHITVPGTYVVHLTNGTDLQDVCYKPIDLNFTNNFNIAAVPPTRLASVDAFNCAPTQMTLHFDKDIQASTLQADGSDFTISGAAGITITGASMVTGSTQDVVVTFSQRIVSGTSIDIGVKPNTILDACYQNIDPTPLNIPLNFQPGATFTVLSTTTCSPNQITLQFNKAIQCNTLQANGADFTISNLPADIITSATCGANNTVILSLRSRILTGGTYNVSIRSNTLLDECYQPTPANTNGNFTVTQQPNVTLLNNIDPGCAAPTIKIDFSGAIRCSSLELDGSQFSLTGTATTPTITSIRTNCANDLVTSVELVLSAPIAVKGNYTVTIKTGNSGKTIESECYIPIAAGVNTTFFTQGTVNADFTYNVDQSCSSTQVQFNHPGTNDVNSWRWTVDGQVVSTEQNPLITFNALGTYNIQLEVSNGTCTDQAQATITLRKLATASFTLNSTNFCPQDQVIFTNTSSGDIASQMWDFGDGTGTNIPTPPNKIYKNTGSDQTYLIRLIVTTSNGCNDTATQTIKVSATCTVMVPTAFTPNNDGKNDFLYPVNGQKATSFNFKVFNRYGQLIFESSSMSRRWDGSLNGQPQPAGTYVWMLEYIDRDTNQKVFLKGHSVLIR